MRGSFSLRNSIGLLILKSPYVRDNGGKLFRPIILRTYGVITSRSISSLQCKSSKFYKSQDSFIPQNCGCLPLRNREHSRHYQREWPKSSICMSVLSAIGLYIGYLIYTKKKWYSTDSISHSILLSNIFQFPYVSAASPFFKTGDKDVIENDKKANKSSGGRDTYNFIADAVEKVTDGVVYIDIKDPRRRTHFGEMSSISTGSGFIVSKDGLILTNAHVVTNKPRASPIIIRLADGREFDGIVEELDAISDLALVRIKCDNLSPLKLGSSKSIRVGEFVVALGSPLSLSNTVTSGVISSVRRHSEELGLKGRDLAYIQTDAAITFGNSGGPLINLDGEVIGINSMKVTSGISFAIPIDSGKEFLEKARKKKMDIDKYRKDAPTGQRRRYLGITMLSLTPEILLEMQQRSTRHPQIPPDVAHGILVWRLVVNSPAYNAGLEPGDVITHINSKQISSARDVYHLLEGHGDLNMVVIRNGQRFAVSVAPEE